MKKFVAAITAVFFAVALVLVGAAAPASAHTLAFTATAACNAADGSGTITWKITNQWGEVLDVTSSDNATIPTTTKLAAANNNTQPTVSFVQHIAAPAKGVSVTAHVSFKWEGDNVTNSSSATGKISSDCNVPTPPTPTDASVTFNDNGATCSSAETVSEGDHTNADWAAIVWTNNNTHYVAVATAQDGHKFPAGPKVSPDGKTKTYSGDLAGKLTTHCGYVIAAWTMPSWSGNDQVPTWSQTLYHSEPQSTPDLNALDKLLALTCGTQYQIDIYYDSPTTTSLINGKFLTKPNVPAEDLIPGGWGVAYKLIHEPDCQVIPKDATAYVHFTAVCGADGVLGDHGTTYATFEGDAPVINGGTWSWVVDAADGHHFSDGSSKETLTGDVPAAIPFQSTDSEGRCYVEPPKKHDANASVTFTPGTCGAAGEVVLPPYTSHASFDTTLPTITDGTWTWSATAEHGHLFIDNGLSTETFSGTVPAAIAYQDSDSAAPCYNEPPADAAATVTFSNGTCDGPGTTPTASLTHATWTQQTIDTATGTYDWIATATAHHEFPGSHPTLELQGTLPVQIPSQSLNPNGTCYVAPPKDAAATVTVTDATCDAPAMVMYGDKTNATFDTVNSTADGATGATVDSFTIIADAIAGHAFNPLTAEPVTHSFNADADNQPANTIETFTGSLAPATGHQETDPSAPCFDGPPIVLTDPTGSSCTTLDANTTLDSWVHVDLADHVTYHIHLVSSSSAADGILTQSYTSEDPGTYLITADADTGWTLAATSTQPAGSEHSWTLNVTSLGTCQLPPGATWHAHAAASGAVCTSSSTQAGTITLEHLRSEKGDVVYTITNKATSKVVYSGRFHTSVKVAPGSYAVHAAAFVTTDGISTATDWNLTVAAAGTVCSTLTTLAFTGASGSMGLFLAGGMLFLGIAGLLMRRRFSHRRA